MCCCGSGFLKLDDPSLASKSRFLGQQGFQWYKFIMSLYFVFWCVWWPLVEGVDDAYKFATYWTFYTAAIYFVISAFTAYKFVGVPATPMPEQRQLVGNEALSGSDHFILGLQVLLWNASSIGSYIAVSVFWIFLYEGGELSTTDINAHILIAVFMSVEMLVVATEYKLRQLFACELFGIVYIIFNFLYYVFAEEDRVIYSVLDWGEPVSAILFAAALVFILVPVFAIVYLGIYRLRECIYESRTRNNPSSPSRLLDLERGLVGERVVTGTSRT